MGDSTMQPIWSSRRRTRNHGQCQSGDDPTVGNNVAGDRSVRGFTQRERLVSISRAVPCGAPAKLIDVARLMVDCDMEYQSSLAWT